MNTSTLVFLVVALVASVVAAQAPADITERATSILVNTFNRKFKNTASTVCDSGVDGA